MKPEELKYWTRGDIYGRFGYRTVKGTILPEHRDDLEDDPQLWDPIEERDYSDSLDKKI